MCGLCRDLGVHLKTIFFIGVEPIECDDYAVRVFSWRGALFVEQALHDCVRHDEEAGLLVLERLCFFADVVCQHFLVGKCGIFMIYSWSHELCVKGWCACPCGKSIERRWSELPDCLQNGSVTCAVCDAAELPMVYQLSDVRAEHREAAIW